MCSRMTLCNRNVFKALRVVCVRIGLIYSRKYDQDTCKSSNVCKVIVMKHNDILTNAGRPRRANYDKDNFVRFNS
jgi:hypothetical protein